MISRVALIFMVLASVAVLLLPIIVSAQADDITGIGVVGEEIELGKGDLRVTIGKIINAALGFLGVVAIIVVLVGGFKYMTAGGSDEKVAEARKWIISGIIGLAIILSAYAITTFVISQLLEATQE